MTLSDPIADMLTRIRNALAQKHETVSMPSSKEKERIAKILVEEGYINGFSTEADGVKKSLTIDLKYGKNGEKVISGLKRISKPGFRVYAPADNLPRVLNGLGTAIISTSKGVMTDRDAKKANVGGEVIAYIW
ncbi:30S ribosomal protein S8 [Allobaculum stercoricanis]|uniref:30S ribosomal protein S8 n=1 Tax=Allobaculum stercoricanis TaxID=174709 RepID=UPI00038291A1|nr:30S ribosomal protein S8 [Allobaculum stercoricanis]MDO4663508.1 30S ribosomal protein S8 [Erysipelotrichaceae bacterium]